MDYVYIVFDPNDDVLGVYTSEQLAETDIKRVIEEGMFSENSKGVFVIRDFELVTE